MMEVSKKQALNNFLEISKNLLEDVKNNSDSFREKMYYTESVTIYQKEPILKYIKPVDFVKAFVETKPDARINIASVMLARYKKVHILEFLLPELEWLREVVSLLESEYESRKGKISAMQICYLKDRYLVPAIMILDEASKHDTD